MQRGGFLSPREGPVPAQVPIDDPAPPDYGSEPRGQRQQLPPPNTHTHTRAPSAAPKLTLIKTHALQAIPLFAQVDKAILQASQVYASNSAYVAAQVDRQRAYHAQNLESYRAAREHYLKAVEGGVEYLKRVGITGAVKAAADEVAARVADARQLPGVVLTKVHESVDALLALAPVHKALEGVKPTLDAAWKRYDGVHDSVVSSPQYRRAVEAGQSVLARAQATQLYATGKARLYPYVAPYAEPAAARLQPYYLRVVEHLAPKA